MTGRKKIPTEIKKARGTLRKCRELDNPMEVAKVNALPAAPKWLSKIGKEQFNIVVNQLNNLGMLYEVDLKLIESYANAMALHIESEQQLRKVGRIQVYRDNETGDIKHSQITPLQTISKQALESALKIATQFGLTPSSRTKISAPKIEVKDNEFNFFND
tara:strand:+ start:626 stop:1105 length:480 start_codon:yes stop_codon:yes gene_type:complete